MNIFYILMSYVLILMYWIFICRTLFRILVKYQSSSMISWVLIIYIFPLLGSIVYYLFGELNLGRKRKKRSKFLYLFMRKKMIELESNQKWISINKISEVAQPIFQFCKHYYGIYGVRNNYIRLLTKSNLTFLMLIQDFNLAKSNIKIVSYIWQIGGMMDQVIHSLIDAAKRGVKCRLILDSVGSAKFFRSPYPKLMRSFGISIVEALKINISCIFIRRIDLRQHRKIILIDNVISYTGSMNMVDPYLFKKNIGIGKWIDIMIRTNGPVTSLLNIVFTYDWKMETGKKIHTYIPKNIYKRKKKFVNQYCSTQVIASGPEFPSKNVLHQILLISIYSAKKKIIITTPYLIPSNDLINAICTAAKRGVKVYLIVPKYNDSILVSWASRSFFDKLLKSGVLIYQFIDGFLHTKSILIDEQLSLIGTVNLDTRSLWINSEITLIIEGKKFGDTLLTLHNSYISKSNLVKIENWLKRPIWNKIIEKLFSLFNPFL